MTTKNDDEAPTTSTSFMKQYQGIATVFAVMGLGATATAYAGGYASKASVSAIEQRVTKLEVRGEYVEKAVAWQNVATFELAKREGIRVPAPPTPAPSLAEPPTSSHPTAVETPSTSRPR